MDSWLEVVLWLLLSFNTCSITFPFISFWLCTLLRLSFASDFWRKWAVKFIFSLLYDFNSFVLFTVYIYGFYFGRYSCIYPFHSNILAFTAILWPLYFWFESEKKIHSLWNIFGFPFWKLVFPSRAIKRTQQILEGVQDSSATPSRKWGDTFPNVSIDQR